MHKSMTLAPQAQKLTRIETMLEKIYDTLQDIREENEQSWFTPEIQMQVKQAQHEVKQGQSKTFDSAEDLIADLHSYVQN